MRVDYAMRVSMLGLIKTDLEASADKEIEFLDADDNILCVLRFQLLEPVSGLGEKAAYKFKALDDTYVLRNGCSAAGTVARFRIYGVDLDDPTIQGTVGSLTSSSDLKFSRINWNVGTFVIIQNLMITIPQGT